VRFPLHPKQARAAYGAVGLSPSPVGVRSETRPGGVFLLDVLDFIGADMFGEGVTAGRVSAELDSAPADMQTIKVRINSPGGSASDGSAIRSLLRQFAAERKATIAVEIHGIAASAASAIAMAGDTIEMATDAIMMIHNPWTIAIGDSTAMRKEADVLDVHERAYAKMYAVRTGRSEDSIRELMRDETWMDSEIAIGYGFATGILPEGTEAPADNGSNERVALARESLGLPGTGQHFDFIAAAAVMPAGVQKTEPKEKHMNPEILKALGLTADARDPEVLAAIQAITAQVGEQRNIIDQARADLKAERERGEEIRAQAERELAFTHKIDLAQASGKLEPAQADKYRARFNAAKERGPEALAFFIESASEDLEVVRSKKTEPLETPEASNPTPEASNPAFARWLKTQGDNLKITDANVAFAMEQ